MIHISIPSYRTLTDHEDPFNKYTVYDIQVNGAFHASVRYNLLYSLHEKLIDIFGFRLNAPDFPPKKLWKLDTKSLNERREGLAKYLQGVITNPDVARHTILERVFLDFQVRSFSSSMSRVIRLEIFLPDGRPVNVECGYDDPTNVVMEKFCRAIGLNEKNSKYFGLFLCLLRSSNQRQNKSEVSTSSSSSDVLFDTICIRWLKNFEAPFISQQLVNKGCDFVDSLHKIVVHRVTWDPSVEEPLLDDPGSLKVLYLQAINDIQRNLLKIPYELKEKLHSLQEYGDFKKFLRLCHLQPNYGYEQLSPVLSDFPSEGTLCELKVGRRQLVLEYQDADVCRILVKVVRYNLPSKRIRVWRVSHSESQLSQMTFQIEYLQHKDEFGLISLRTDQAVILSLFLQSIADEILQDHHISETSSFKFDDNISLKAAETLEASKANSVVADNLSIKSYSSTNGGTNSNSLLEPMNGTNQRIKLISHQMPFLDNENFEDITDADL